MFINFLFIVAMLCAIPFLAHAVSFVLSKLSLCLNMNTVEILKTSSVMAFAVVSLGLAIIALSQIYNIVLVLTSSLISSLA